MPKFRSVHTKITQSFDFNEMPDDFTRLLWVLLPLGLDCEGRGIYNASWIKSKIFPLREDVSQKQITSAMEWYAARGMVEIYDVDNRQYFWAIKFQEYQRGFEKEAPSLLPAPFDTYSISTPELVKSSSPLNTHTQTQSNSQTNTDTQPDEEEPVVVPISKAKEKTPLKAQAASMLTARLVSKDILKELLDIYKPDMLIDYCHAYDQALMDKKADNPGWLVKALKQEWNIKALLKKHEEVVRNKLKLEDPALIYGKYAEELA